LNYRKTIRNTYSILNPNQVSYMIFYVTNRCNFRCNFCFYSAEIEKGLKPNEMTVEEIRKFEEISFISRSTGLTPKFPNPNPNLGLHRDGTSKSEELESGKG